MTRGKNSRNGIEEHHKIPKCEGGSNHFDNLVKMLGVKHDVYHQVTDRKGRATKPIEHLYQHFELMDGVYVPNFPKIVLEIIQDLGEDVYNPKCIKR